MTCTPGMCNPTNPSSEGNCPCRYARLHRVYMQDQQTRPESVIAPILAFVAACLTLAFIFFL